MILVNLSDVLKVCALILCWTECLTGSRGRWTSLLDLISSCVRVRESFTLPSFLCWSFGYSCTNLLPVARARVYRVSNFSSYCVPFQEFLVDRSLLMGTVMLYDVIYAKRTLILIHRCSVKLEKRWRINKQRCDFSSGSCPSLNLLYYSYAWSMRFHTKSASGKRFRSDTAVVFLVRLIKWTGWERWALAAKCGQSYLLSLCVCVYI